jgi:NAD(P)-dependent dehydrogenase (short-subunit alcohol dehydrogenase family)
MQNLSGKVCVITGAASGIGRGIANAFAERGSNIVIADVDSAAASEAASELSARYGVRATAAVTDVADLASVRALADFAYETFGEVHLLCNNAGVNCGGSVADLSVSDWRWVMSVNVEGVINGLISFLPRMRQQTGERHIVNTGSMASWVPLPGFCGVYTATKHFVAGITDVLRDELAEEGIGVSLLCPGGTATNIATCERNRPESLGPSRPFGPIPDDPLVMPAGALMDPINLGRRVRVGVERNEAYILPDPDYPYWKERAEVRFQLVLDAFESAP